MAGGISGAELAAAVSRAGALGTVGLQGPSRFRAELARAKTLARGHPIAANLLMPFVHRAHVAACIDAGVAAVVLFFGFDAALVAMLRRAGVIVLHQVGTAQQARRALRDGADGLIAQGREAGGHLLGEAPAHDTLASVLEVADAAPVFLAGGVARADHVRDALRAGAAGVLCGSRFLLSDECRAHPLWKRRALGARETLETELFGFGWPARHRVLPNEATRRWCARDPRGPAWLRAMHRATAPLARVAPMDDSAHLARAQRPAVPIFSPKGPLEGEPDAVVESSALYAGRCVRDIDTVLPAEQIVRELAKGFER
jgi:NAD(P)H-dependent flavin oxidoreductase YrpB (nitropropane dioxygenase family)